MPSLVTLLIYLMQSIFSQKDMVVISSLTLNTGESSCIAFICSMNSLHSLRPPITPYLSSSHCRRYLISCIRLGVSDCVEFVIVITVAPIRIFGVRLRFRRPISEHSVFAWCSPMWSARKVDHWSEFSTLFGGCQGLSSLCLQQHTEVPTYPFSGFWVCIWRIVCKLLKNKLCSRGKF